MKDLKHLYEFENLLQEANNELVKKAKELAKAGKESCSLLYKHDLRFNPKRAFYVYAQLFRQKKKFKVYYPR